MALTVVSALASGIFAASNPIVLKLQKYDWQYDAIYESGGGYAVLTHTTVPVPDEFVIGQTIRVYGSVVTGTYEITDIDVGQVNLNLLYDAGMAADSGYVINTEAFPLPYVETEVYRDTVLIGTLYNSPDIDGLITIDFSRMVKSLLNKENVSSYQEINFLDLNLSSYFKYHYLEHWEGSTLDTPSPDWSNYSGNIYIIQAAMQLGDVGGGNLSKYQIKDIPYYDQTKFCTKFLYPRFFKDYPFDISFIWYTGVPQPPQVTRIVRQDLNINHSQVDTDSINLENALGYGLHRFLVEDSISAQCVYIFLEMQTEINAAFEECINPITIDYDQSCYDNPIYLCWLNTLGGWDYWLFHTYQEDSIEISDSQKMVKHISDYENDTVQKDIVRKYPEPYYLLGADGLTLQQIEGIKNLMYSTKVMMLINHAEWLAGRNDTPPVEPIWHTVVVKDMTFKTPRSRDSKGSVEFEIELPIINVQ